MVDVKTKYKKSVHSLKVGVKTTLPMCEVSKNYRQRIMHVLEEAYAGLTWVA